MAPQAEAEDEAGLLVDLWLVDHGDVEVDDAGGTLTDVFSVEVEAREGLERRISEALQIGLDAERLLTKALEEAERELEAARAEIRVFRAALDAK